MVIDTARQAHPARWRDLLQSRGYVDAVAENVVTIDDDVAFVHADAQDEPTILGLGLVATSHCALQFHRELDGVDHARELDQQAVSGRLDQPAAMLGDLRVDEFASNRL